MTDDARRPLTEEERARIHAARARADMCARCGRELVGGEAIWMERLTIHHERGGTTHWRAPVGAECVSPETIRATGATEPEPCLGCGRGVHYGATAYPRDFVVCSGRCRNRYERARAKEARGS